MNKFCASCQTQKPSSAFAKNASRSDGLQGYCRECMKATFKNHPAHMTVGYGFASRYAEMLESQNGTCAVCGIQPSGRRLSVDHDHVCCPGKKSCGECVRGLLCTACNFAVGRYEHGLSVKRLDAIEAYLGVKVAA